MLNNSKLNNSIVITNFLNVKYKLLIPPILFLVVGGLYFALFLNQGDYVTAYVNIQKDLFFYLNGKLSTFSSLQYNLTQLGDALILYPLVTHFIIYTPKFWEGLLYSSILSLIVSAVLKKLFAMPRPAAMFDHDTFAIIGKTLTGHTSLPSGHSMTTFIVITTCLFAFMPKKTLNKMGWWAFMLSLGLFIAFSRVGVGAHYPLDVITGSTIGFIIAVFGIKISNKVNWLSWIQNKRFYPFFILAFAVMIFIISKKTLKEDLFIYYVSIISLVISLYTISTSYVKHAKRKN